MMSSCTPPKRLDSTYEGLKRAPRRVRKPTLISRLDSTYEGLKRRVVRGLGDHGRGLDSTYEGLKRRWQVGGGAALAVWTVPMRA